MQLGYRYPINGGNRDVTPWIRLINSLQLNSSLGKTLSFCKKKSGGRYFYPDSGKVFRAESKSQLKSKSSNRYGQYGDHFKANENKYRKSGRLGYENFLSILDRIF